MSATPFTPTRRRTQRCGRRDPRRRSDRTAERDVVRRTQGLRIHCGAMVTVDGSPRRARYGVDAPYLLPVAGVVSLANVVVAAMSRSVGPVIAACAVLVSVGLALHTSRRGKFLVWTELLDDLQLKGDERILDLGCGRGAVLLATAKRLNRGHAIGVDIWNRFDQSGNSVDSTRRNAEAEGVSGRVAPLTANMMALPFHAGTFDWWSPMSRSTTSKIKSVGPRRSMKRCGCCARAAVCFSQIFPAPVRTNGASWGLAWLRSVGAGRHTW